MTTISQRARSTGPAVQEMPAQTALLTQDQVQAAFDVLTAGSDTAGAARGMVIRTEYKAKRVLSRLFLQAPETMKTADAKKAWATCHDEYAKACEEHAQAEARWEMEKDKRNKAQLVLECWRTLCSNERGIVRAGR